MYNKLYVRSVNLSIADDKAKLNVVKGMSLIRVEKGDKVDYLMPSRHPSNSSYHNEHGIYYTRTVNFSITDADVKLNVVISSVMAGKVVYSTSCWNSMID